MLAIALPAAAESPPRQVKPQVAEIPPPGLSPKEEEILERELEEEEWIEQKEPVQQGKSRPPAKAAPAQAGAKQAPTGSHPETAPQAQKRTQTPRQVSGTILGMKVVEVRGAGEENVVALIKTERGDRRLAIDLGPISQLERSELRLGGKVAVEGYVVSVRDQQFVVATRVKPEGGAILLVRRPAQARLESDGGPLPASDQPPLPPNQAVPSLPPPDSLERGPLPPPQFTPKPQPSPRQPSDRSNTPSNKPKSLIDEQQRPGGQ